MAKNGQFDNIISLVITKYASRMQPCDKDDLKQEAALSLLEAKEHYVGDIPEKLAYKIVRNRIINDLKRMPPRSEDITHPDVIRKFDKQSIHFPDEGMRLDALKAKELLNELPDVEQFILRHSFGIEGTQLTEEEIAEMLLMSRALVHKKKQEALDRLKEIMENK